MLWGPTNTTVASSPWGSTHAVPSVKSNFKNCTKFAKNNPSLMCYCVTSFGWRTWIKLEVLRLVSVLQVNTWYDVIICGDATCDAELARDVWKMELNAACWVMPFDASRWASCVLGVNFPSIFIPMEHDVIINRKWCDY